MVMDTNAVELQVNRRITTAFIRTQPVALTLVPRAQVKKPTGGFEWEDQPARDPQVMRLVEPSNPARPVRSLDGIDRVVEFMLLGEHDAQLGVYDRFTHDGAPWEVVFLYHFNGWERRAEVARRG